MRLRRRRVKTVAAIVALVGVALAFAVVSHLCCLSGSPEDREMRSLVARLSHATERHITFGDMILWTVPADKTVYMEIDANGKMAVPYLIEGLHDCNEDIRRQCAGVLADIPSREGLGALINCLRETSELKPRASEVDWSLVRLTGYGEWNGRRAVTPEGRKHWLDWWEANKDKLVETDTGLGIRNPDGTITMLGKKKPAR